MRSKDFCCLDTYLVKGFRQCLYAKVPSLSRMHYRFGDAVYAKLEKKTSTAFNIFLPIAYLRNTHKRTPLCTEIDLTWRDRIELSGRCIRQNVPIGQCVVQNWLFNQIDQMNELKTDMLKSNHFS